MLGAVKNFAGGIGARTLGGFEDVKYSVGFFGKICRSVFSFVLRGRVSYRILIMQILFTFVEALLISSLLALGIGCAVIVMGYPFLAGFSQESLIYPLITAVIMRELGPLLTAFIIIARSGTAIATEVAGMVVSSEIEAYVSVGIDPIEHIAVPRFLGVTVSLMLLNIYFSLFGLVGSYCVSLFFTSIAPSEYFAGILQNFSIVDLFFSLLKSFVFGVAIATTALLQGFSVERSMTEIPVAGLRAVGKSFGSCIFADVLLTVLFYLM